MHPYSTDSPANPKLIGFLALVAVAITSGLKLMLDRLQIDAGWYVGGFTGMTVFGGLYFVFNKWVWKLKAVRKVLLVPDLNGTWTCSGRTVMKSGNQVDYAWTGTVTIAQSWSKIAITLKTSQSASESIAASLYRMPAGGGHRLIYHYHNAPVVGEHELVQHTGLCRLEFDPGEETASGNYYTDRDRLTVGTMHLTRKRDSDEQARTSSATPA